MCGVPLGKADPIAVTLQLHAPVQHSSSCISQGDSGGNTHWRFLLMQPRYYSQANKMSTMTCFVLQPVAYLDSERSLCALLVLCPAARTMWRRCVWSSQVQ